MAAEPTHEGRAAVHARNLALEDALGELAALLGQVEDPLVRPGVGPRMPVLFLVGGPRAGSTVMMQVLAASGGFAYPTNLLARFAAAPAIGARIQRILVDPALDFRSELQDVGSPVRFTSDLGKSSGARQPNEIWYWWRRFTPTVEPAQLTADQREGLDLGGFAAEVAAVEAVLGRPMAMNALHLQLDLDLLVAAFPAAIVLDVRRDPLFQMQSVLLARRHYFGDDARWWSLRPAGHESLADADPHTQVAGQVLAIHRRLDELVGRLPPGRVVRTDYATMCRQPGEVLAAVADRYARSGVTLELELPPPDAVVTRDEWRVGAEDRRRLESAWVALGGDPDAPAPFAD